MSLDFAQVAPQLQQLLTEHKRTAGAHRSQLELVRQGFLGEPSKWEALREQSTEEPNRIVPLPPCPQDYSVLATDGSQIEIDRHAPLPFYLINVGQVILRYGTASYAQLSSHPSPRLVEKFLAPEEHPDDTAVEEQDRVNVGLERSVAELQRLAELVRSADLACFTLALVDGSLTLWTAGAERYQRITKRYLQEYVSYLEAIGQHAHHRPLALASYISHPGSAEVARALKLEHLLDLDIFDALLKEAGQRSAVFLSQYHTPQPYQLEGPIYFFYINAGPEIGRVEVPAWVAQNPEQLDMAHVIIYDQCRRNFGYPVALMEAHEQAVVSEADRKAFWQLVDQHLIREGLPTTESVKSRSKRIPWA